MIEVQRFTVFTDGHADLAAADSTTYLRISCALVAILVMRQRMSGMLGTFVEDMRDAVRHAACLGKQQGEDQQ